MPDHHRIIISCSLADAPYESARLSPEAGLHSAPEGLVSFLPSCALYRTDFSATGIDRWNARYPLPQVRLAATEATSMQQFMLDPSNAMRSPGIRDR